MSVRVFTGDCRTVLAEMETASVDACITDPPYGLKFMGKGWDRGVPGVEFWTEVLRVLAAGAFLLAFGGTRTYHRLTCAIEDAGFEVCDCLSWLYGSGFPKHKSKLKPAWEPIVMARKPAPKATLLNIDDCRIGTGGQLKWEQPRDMGYHGGTDAGSVAATESASGRWPANVLLDEEAAAALDEQSGERSGGAWPANGSRFGYGGGDRKQNGERTELGDSGGASRFFYTAKASRAEREAGLTGEARTVGRYSEQGQGHLPQQTPRVETPQRNHHPTVKPVDLMRWLVRLVTPPNGLVLDPFTGSGTTGVAAVLEDRRFVGIEREAEYVAIAEARIRRAAEQGSLFREIA